MPELPEVQTIVTSLSPRLTGQMIVSVPHCRADLVTPEGFALRRHLVGRRVRSIDRRGKRIVLTLDDGNRWFIHLGMSGRLTVEPNDATLLPHTHLVVQFQNVRQLRLRDPRRFGCIGWLGQSDDDSLGPEPLTIRANQLARRLSGTRRAIKTALLDQRLLAGLGNIYVDEALFSAGIHPTTPAHALAPAQVRRLTLQIKKVLKRAILHRGSTLRDYVDAAGLPGSFQRLHDVYGRTGSPCRRCGAAIERITLGGRSTHFCPCCQRAASGLP